MGAFAISDIHGHNKEFISLLKKITLKKADILFLLGDFIDRGPESKEVLDTIFSLIDNGYDVRCIRGNHEQMFLDGLNDFEIRMQWYKNGGNETLSSFLTSDINRIAPKYIDFLNELPYYLTFEDFIFVHAGLNMNIENPFDDTVSILWLRDRKKSFNQNWLGTRRVIHGHTPMKLEFLLSEGNLNAPIINIDNGIYLKGSQYFGNLLALDLVKMKIVK